MKIGNRQIYGSRWPWQIRTSVGALDFGANKVGDKYGWWGSGGMGRFGGGWNWELGIQIGGSSVILSLIWGSVTISKMPRCKECDEYIHRGRPSAKYPDWGYHPECVPSKPAPKEPDPPSLPREPVVNVDDGCPF